MPLNVDQVGKYLGKTIEDAMGRPLGKLVGLTTDLKDEVKAIQIAHSDGGVAEHSINFVKIVNDHLTLLQEWRVEADDLKRENEIVKRRSQALDLLLKDGDISQIEYNQLRTSYEDLSKEIHSKRETLLDSLGEVETRLDQQINDLQSALTNNKILYSATEIDEQTYRSVTESIRSGLEIARKERRDVENTREYLNDMGSNIREILREPLSLNESQEKEIERVTSKSSMSDVVVIKMNELSQA